MKNFSLIILLLVVCGVFLRYKSVSVNNTDLEQFIGKWGAPREQFYFAKTDNGLSMSIYRSPQETLTKEGSYLVVKNQSSLEYVENAGGKLFFKDGNFVFDYFVTDKLKLLFTFQKKENYAYYFTATHDGIEHKLILSAQDNVLFFDVIAQGYQEYLFRGDKMKY